jgi:hypothetical protein
MHMNRFGDAGNSGYDLTTATPATQPQATGLVASLLQLGTGVVSLINQQKIANANIKLAAAGQPMINPAAVPGATPTAQVNVSAGISPDTQKLLIYGGLALGAWLLFGK